MILAATTCSTLLSERIIIQNNSIYLPLSHPRQITSGCDTAQNPHELGMLWDLEHTSATEIEPARVVV